MNAMPQAQYKEEPKHVEIQMDAAFALAAVSGMVSFTTNPVNVSRWTIVTINGLNLPTSNPSVVLVTPRHSANASLGVSDNFSVIVTETARSFIRFNVWRVDSGQDPSINYRFGVAIIP
jgi:hypothetical protein